jgi:hypothetical protein
MRIQGRLIMRIEKSLEMDGNESAEFRDASLPEYELESRGVELRN